MAISKKEINEKGKAKIRKRTRIVAEIHEFLKSHKDLEKSESCKPVRRGFRAKRFKS